MNDKAFRKIVKQLEEAGRSPFADTLGSQLSTHITSTQSGTTWTMDIEHSRTKITIDGDAPQASSDAPSATPTPITE